MVRKLEQPVAVVRKIEVLLVDDHPIVRQGLASMIEQEVDLHVCGEADDADKALAEVRRLAPDIAIIDVSLKESNGLELVKQIRSEFPDLPMLVLSMHDEQMYAPRALKAGAKGYIMKQEAPTQLVDALRQILKGEIYLSSNMTSQMVSQAVIPPSPTGGRRPRPRSPPGRPGRARCRAPGRCPRPWRGWSCRPCRCGRRRHSCRRRLRGSA